MKKKWWVFFVVVLLVVVVGVGANSLIQGWRAAAQQAPETATVSPGTLLVTVKGTGSVEPGAEVSLSLQASGQVVEVLVEEGTAVVAGQPLIRLDTAELELQLAQAEASLAQSQASLLQAQISLSKTVATADANDVTVAQNSLAEAQNSLQNQETALSVSTEQARLSWVTAANKLRDAQANYSQIYWDNRDLEDKLADIGETLPQDKIDAEAEAWRAVENAQAAMTQAQLSYEQAQQSQSTALSTARSQVSTARANLAGLTAAASSVDVAAGQASIAQTQAAVDQAQVSVDQARLQLAKAVLVAPSAGTVTAVNVAVGEWAGAGQAVVVLSDLANLQVQVSLDETDVARVAVGQPVQVRLDAFTEAELSGQVQEIALSAQAQAGVVLYPTTIRLDATSIPVRLGMTAEATIVTAQRENTLVVPLRAVETLDGHAYVRRMTAAGQSERIEVTLGLMNDTEAEITAGLAEGDQVVLDPAAVSTAASSFPGPFGRLK